MHPNQLAWLLGQYQMNKPDIPTHRPYQDHSTTRGDNTL